MKISEDKNTITLPKLMAIPAISSCDCCYFQQAYGNTTQLAPEPCLEELCMPRKRPDRQRVIFVEAQDED